MKRVQNSRFDLTGNGIIRVMKLAAFGKIVPVGNLRGGPGIRCLVVVGLLHFFGYPIYYINARYGHRLGPVKRIVGRVRKR
ncbi:hypothetical protein [Desulforhopalus singaporensis]|uniref:Uncharacterized protein n=1 Tax=Desulforhopalus singaporensis TaxID=91360 RepID=A0A1H0PZN4_9BACT|nr:hypothetical protein [Desulforhopalus singaporensis]SDP09839.1 hypothetical protein SAMN05660330_01805 [Desulforhopalus singaporensis]